MVGWYNFDDVIVSLIDLLSCKFYGRFFFLIFFFVVFVISTWCIE